MLGAMLDTARSATLLAVLFLAACSSVAPDPEPEPEPDPDAQPQEGVCGGANGVQLAQAPSTGLCAVGTSSEVEGSGPWTWTCSGSDGGQSASCSAEKAGSEGPRLPVAGNPDGSCTSIPLPAEAALVDTSNPDHVVGTGSAASCTFAALKAAVAQGGRITFNCGEDLVTIPIDETLRPPWTNGYDTPRPAPVTTVIDGGNRITLDGQGRRRILHWEHVGSWLNNDDLLVLQRIRLINGKATPTDAIEACDESPNDRCPTGHYDGQGGAIYARDGQLRIIESTFADNEAALLGPDTGGGAIYMHGTAHTIQIARSTFTHNKGSNAGAIGVLYGGAFISNSLFVGNAATGTGANAYDPSGCACTAAHEHQVGSGGNGGAIYHDGGDDQTFTLCGTQIRENAANEHGAAVFFTNNGSSAKLVIYDTLVKENSNGHPYWQWCASISTDACGISPDPVGSTFCQETESSCASSCTGGC